MTSQVKKNIGSSNSNSEKSGQHPPLNENIPDIWISPILKSYNSKLSRFKKSIQPVKSIQEMKNSLDTLTTETKYFRSKYSIFLEPKEELIFLLMLFIDYPAVYKSFYLAEWFGGLLKTDEEIEKAKAFFFNTCKKMRNLSLLNLQEVRHKLTKTYVHLYYSEFHDPGELKTMISEVKHRKYGFDKPEKIIEIRNQTKRDLCLKCTDERVSNRLYCKKHQKESELKFKKQERLRKKYEVEKNGSFK